MNYAAQEYAAQGLLHPFQRFGPYQIDRILGSGAVAVVYSAHTQDGRSVALKILTPVAANQPQVRQLFQHEYRILSRLRHPGVVQVHDAGQIDNRPYIALALVQGQTLEEFLTRTPTPGEAVSLEIARQVADTLDYLHRHDVVHRDIKPGNLLINQERRVLLFDFGTALDRRMPLGHEERGIYGTPAFLAPEQIRNDPQIDGRADLYALGIILYRMITGRKPFYGSRSEVLKAHLEEPPPKPSKFAYVSPSVEASILKAIAKDPGDRFQTGAEFARALEEATIVEPPEQESLHHRILKWFRRESPPLSTNHGE